MFTYHNKHFMVGKVQALVGIVQACLHSVKSFKSVQMCMIRYFCICILHSLVFHFSSSFIYVSCYKKLNGSWWKKRTLLCFRRCALSVNGGEKITKEAQGSHRSPEKQFEIINTFLQMRHFGWNWTNGSGEEKKIE